MTSSNPKTSDLGVRAISGLVMLAIFGVALWLGGMAWLIFVVTVGVGVWFEWSALSIAMQPPGARRTGWRAAGAIYAGIGCAMLIALREQPAGIFWVLLIVGTVIAVDVGAYAFGRTIGGPKIAPAISPSKTWAGLLGGAVGATIALVLWLGDGVPKDSPVWAGGGTGVALEPVFLVLLGLLFAVVAQAGDFFESWMKRRAGVKDSGSLIPGHGGLFDRVDGLLAVLVVMGLLIPLARFA